MKVSQHARRALQARSHLPEEEMCRLLTHGYGVPVAMEGFKSHTVVWDGQHGIMPVFDTRNSTVITVLLPDFNCRTGAIAGRALEISRARVEAQDPSIDRWKIFGARHEQDLELGEWVGPTQGTESQIAEAALAAPKIQQLLQEAPPACPVWLESYHSPRVILLWDRLTIPHDVGCPPLFDAGHKSGQGSQRKLSALELMAPHVNDHTDPAQVVKRIKKILTKGHTWAVMVEALSQCIQDEHRRAEILDMI